MKGLIGVVAWLMAVFLGGAVAGAPAPLPKPGPVEWRESDVLGEYQADYFGEKLWFRLKAGGVYSSMWRYEAFEGVWRLEGEWVKVEEWSGVYPGTAHNQWKIRLRKAPGRGTQRPMRHGYECQV